jgi:hypothetical protein
MGLAEVANLDATHKLRIHDTTGCATGWPTGCATDCVYCIHDTAGCTTCWATGCKYVYTAQPVAKPVVQPVASTVMNINLFITPRPP